MEIDHLHLYVEDAPRWQQWFIQTLSFEPYGPAQATALGVRGGQIRVVLSDPHLGGAAVGAFLSRYSPGVGDVAFRVANLDRTLSHAVQAGAKVLLPPQPWGTGRAAQVQGWGSLCHTLIEAIVPFPRDSPSAPLSPQQAEMGADRPSSEPLAEPQDRNPQGSTRCPGMVHSLPWQRVDHAVLNVADGALEAAADWYCRVFRFQVQQRFAIQTAQSGLRSLVLRHPEGTATLPINEPTSANSQVQEFLDCHRGAGVQHVALGTAPLLTTLPVLRDRGLSFLSVPQPYYERLCDRPGFWAEAPDWADIAQQQVLVDWAPETPRARLLQTFTAPLFQQPTFFLELIERQREDRGDRAIQAEGFGEGNFQALFEAIERQQQQRGSL